MARLLTFFYAPVWLLAATLAVYAPVRAQGEEAKRAAPPSMICVVEGMGSGISEGALCTKLEHLLGLRMLSRGDPWARDAPGTLRVIGGDVDVVVAVAWRKRRIAWARRSLMELGSDYAAVLAATALRLLPLEALKQARPSRSPPREREGSSGVLHSEIIDPWVLSRTPRGAGLLPWEAATKAP